MRWREWTLIDRAVSEGISTGWHRAHKHTETPDVNEAETQIHRAIMDALGEICVLFDDAPVESTESITNRMRRRTRKVP